MRILFLGDIVGRPGRQSVARWLPGLKREHGIELTVANAENAAGGTGATADTLNELRRHGVNAFSMGNHVWSKKAIIPVLELFPEMARPANYPEGVPGRGAVVVQTDDGRKVALLNLLGRVFMDPLECPFRHADAALAQLRQETPVVLVDMHAEATSEKIAMGWYLDGRCTAVVGTHTHVQTADERILPQGTAYITDIGMCGPRDGVLGVERDVIIQRFLTGMPAKFEVVKSGPLTLSAVVLEVDDASGQTRSIQRISISE